MDSNNNNGIAEVERPRALIWYGDQTYGFQGYKAGDYIFEQLNKLGTFYELGTLEFIKSRALSGTYVDIGANIGNHSLFFLAETKCDALIAIEGNRVLIPIWSQNVESNFRPSKPFRIINEFVSSEEALFFNPDSCENIGSSFLSRVRLGEDSVCIKACRLDGILAKEQRISLLKLDVEGHEMEVLKSAEKILREQSPEICVEAFETAEGSLVSFLMSFGYLPLASLSNGNIYLVKFPRLAFLAVCGLVRLAFRLPKPWGSRMVWRIVRSFAVICGLLPAGMFRKALPGYHSLRAPLGLGTS
jgi:FkbM family methyltransferase